ncbi:hypothetical protein HYH03_013091 [Edaphochlamys debaryana]|uniref:C2 domain-containing protein n=1 Tax=Edaphochlamys debaryana TaxID=47281 RepID=A0A835XRQ9_9CHLO|nr:hypothetical protein HYH03_013091 [Edaphochlamys debaryana]|eukprot:KAG2488407.1 hypothetical protein HYH03_013091 [Edaphochlamys debaryana]
MDTPGKLTVKIGVAKDLASGEGASKQDSYVLIRIGINQLRTKSHHGGSPTWDETFEANLKAERTIEVLVIDNKDDSIRGKATVSLATARVRGSDAREVPLTCPDSGERAGSIGVSLAFQAGAMATQPAVSAKAAAPAAAAPSAGYPMATGGYVPAAAPAGYPQPGGYPATGGYPMGAGGPPPPLPSGYQAGGYPAPYGSAPPPPPGGGKKKDDYSSSSDSDDGGGGGGGGRNGRAAAGVLLVATHRRRAVRRRMLF